jgi:hypothetical protein
MLAKAADAPSEFGECRVVADRMVMPCSIGFSKLKSPAHQYPCLWSLPAKRLSSRSGFINAEVLGSAIRESLRLGERIDRIANK